MLQRQRFFTAAAEHERIATLQPHHAAAASSGANHQSLNRTLRHRVTAGALADKEALGTPGVAQNPIVDERVVQDQVGAAQARDRRPRQQAGIARSGADERDMPARGAGAATIIHSHESSGAFSHGTCCARSTTDCAATSAAAGLPSGPIPSASNGASAAGS